MSSAASSLTGEAPAGPFIEDSVRAQSTQLTHLKQFQDTEQYMPDCLPSDSICPPLRSHPVQLPSSSVIARLHILRDTMEALTAPLGAGRSTLQARLTAPSAAFMRCLAVWSGRGGPSPQVPSSGAASVLPALLVAALLLVGGPLGASSGTGGGILGDAGRTSWWRTKSSTSPLRMEISGWLECLAWPSVRRPPGAEEKLLPRLEPACSGLDPLTEAAGLDGSECSLPLAWRGLSAAVSPVSALGLLTPALLALDRGGEKGLTAAGGAPILHPFLICCCCCDPWLSCSQGGVVAAAPGRSSEELLLCCSRPLPARLPDAAELASELPDDSWAEPDCMKLTKDGSLAMLSRVVCRDLQLCWHRLCRSASCAVRPLGRFLSVTRLERSSLRMLLARLARLLCSGGRADSWERLAASSGALLPSRRSQRLDLARPAAC